MNDLLWWHGIGWNTPIRDIGWTYVLILGLLALAAYSFKRAMRP